MENEVEFLVSRYLRMTRTDQLTILGVVDSQAQKAESAFVGKPGSGEDQIAPSGATVPKQGNQQHYVI